MKFKIESKCFLIFFVVASITSATVEITTTEVSTEITTDIETSTDTSKIETETEVNEESLNDPLAELTSEINAIMLEFNKLIKHLGSTTAPVNGDFNRVGICVSSAVELKVILEMIEFFRGINDTHEIIVIESKSCSEMHQLKLGLLILKYDFSQLVQNLTTLTEYDEHKANFESEFKNFWNVMNETIEKETPENRRMIEELPDQLEAQKRQIDFFFTHLEEKQKTLDDKLVRLCATEWNENQFYSAFEHCEKIFNKSKIHEVITLAYDEDATNFYLFFELLLPRLNDSVWLLGGYTALFEQMQLNNDTDTFDLLVFANAVGKNKGPGFEALTKSLDDLIITKHQNNDYSNFFDGPPLGDVDLGSEIMPIFVRTAYDNDPSNVERVLRLSKRFNYYSARVELVDELLKEMKRRGHLERPEIFSVIKFMKDGYELYNDQRHHIPTALRPLLFDNLCIQNDGNKEFIYVGEPFNNGSTGILNKYSSRWVWTSQTQKSNRSAFDVEFTEHGSNLIFKNSYLNEDLYTTRILGDRLLLSGESDHLKDEKEFLFAIQYADERVVRIKSEKLSEYLCSANVAEGSDRVSLKKDIDSGCLWVLLTCDT